MLKRILTFKLIFCSALLVSGSYTAAQAVDQMFLELPDEFLGNRLNGPDSPSQWPLSERKKLIKEQDIKNGYMLLTSGVEIVKLSRSNKEGPLLIISGDSYADGSRAIGGRLSIFGQNLESKKWTNLTEQFSPKISDMVVNALYQKHCKTKKKLMDSASGTYKYKLPKIGKKLIAVINSDTETKCKNPLFELEFVDSEFQMTIH